MRVRETKSGFSVHAISGSHVVLLGFDMAEEACKDYLHLHQLLGFAIYRVDHTEKEEYWLKGFKTFEETLKDPKPGKTVSTRDHPIQAFMWGDYTAKPKHTYTYRVVALYGTPGDLKEGPTVEVRVSTEDEDQGKHAIFFNRGVGASQAYASRFKNLPPDEVPNREAFIWLSRGLEEAILQFIGQAKGKHFSLRAAVYEFDYDPVLEAFKKAADSGADVRIIYDAREGKDKPVEHSDNAIKKAGIRKLMIKRTKNPSYISHNKFIVLLEDGAPKEVWTGSTNFTEGGIFGQSNVGHIVRNPDTAAEFLAYWEQLSKDPEAKDLRKWNETETPDPVGTPKAPITTIFSPRPSLGALEWYAECLKQADGMSCFTAAFGVNKLLEDVLDDESLCLHYVLLDKNDGDVAMIRHVKSNMVAVGSEITESSLHRWLKEKLTGLNVHVKYIHTKYMLLNPLSDKPLTISGSANFSDASTKNNDENMLVIYGDTIVADIYLCEFMRLFNHYYFRDVMDRQAQAPGTPERASAYLEPDASWVKPYFEKGASKWLERRAFA